MATYEQLMEALRRADAEGNVEDAQRLAQMAAAQRPQGGGGRTPPTRDQLISQIPTTGAPTAPQPRPATSMGQYLFESAKRGLTSTPARLIAGSAAQTGTFGGAFPTQPELEELTTPNIQRRMGVDVDLRPATTTQRMLGAGVEAMADPLNLIGLPATGPARAAVAAGAAAAGVGGEFGGEVGGQVAGVPGQITGGILFALASGGGAIKGVESLLSRGKSVDLKDFNVEDLAGIEGSSVAKDLVEKALAADPGLNARLLDIKKKVDFVGGQSGVLASGGIDNKVFRSALTKLAQSDEKIGSELQKIYTDLQTAVRNKATELYPQPSSTLPSTGKAVAAAEIDFNKRLGAIAAQQAKLTQSLDLGGAPVELGKSIQNLTLAQEAAARSALSPDYNSVKKQASAMGAILPAAQTQSLLDTAKDLFMQDPWGRQSSLLKLVEKQSGEFEKLRGRAAPVSTGQTLPTTGGQNLPALTGDLSVGLDITSLDSLKRRVAEDIRTVKSDSTRDKLILLQQRVDDALNQVQNSSGDVRVNFRGQPTTFGNAMQQLDLDYYTKVGIPFKDADAVQKIGSQEYAERIAPQLAGSPTSMSQFLRIAGDEGVPLAEKAVMSKLYTQSLGKDGYIDPIKLDALLTKTSNNGGYSDILTQLPNLQGRLTDATQRADFLSSQRVAIDDAAKAERVRIGDSFLADYDRGGVEAITARILGANGIGYQAKFMNDLKKLSPDDQTNATLAVRNAMVTKMLDSKNPFDFLNKNKAAYTKMFGKSHVDNLAAMADVQRLATKIDVERLPLNDVAIKQMSALQRLLGGVDPKQVSAIAVNQISSVFNKGFRIAALIGQQNIDQATKEAQRKLFMDPNGLDSTVKATTRLISKKGQEVDLKSLIKPEDLSNVASSLGMSVLRSGYLGGSVAASESEVMPEETGDFYQYTPQE
jgi:hypothetical protein